MAEKTPESFWSNAIQPAVRSPASILAEQAKALGVQTSNLLIGELTTLAGRGDSGADSVQLTLDIYAPSLDYRHRVLTAGHDKNLVYPVAVHAMSFGRNGGTLRKVGATQEKIASTDAEFIELVKGVLTSSEVEAVANALIARVREVAAEEKEAVGTAS